LTAEFRKRLEPLRLDIDKFESVMKLFEEAEQEFPCLACISKDECSNFE
jgi:hypothetical protein